MMKRILLPFNMMGLFFIFLISCGGETRNPSSSTDENEEINTLDEEQTLSLKDTVIQGEGLQLSSLEYIKDYQNYKLELTTPLKGNLEEGEHILTFQLLDEKGKKIKQINNLRVGVMVNNEFYSSKPLEDLSFTLHLMSGNNVVFAYLINEKGNSVKSESTSVLENFYVGSGKSYFNKDQAHLFLIEPRNQLPILDFFLFNVQLSKRGKRIKLTIDDEVFILSNWQAYSINGLDKGMHQIRMQLIDEKDEVVLGPFNDSGLRVVEI